MQFQSPTINCFMLPEDFLALGENPWHYLHCAPKELPDEYMVYHCPVMSLDGLRVYLLHYKSYKEGKEKWIERTKRINWDRLVFICTDRDGMTPALKQRFSKLPAPKIMFIHDAVSDEDRAFAVHIPGFEHDDQVGTLTDHSTRRLVDALKGQRYYEYFDYVDFLNHIYEVPS